MITWSCGYNLHLYLHCSYALIIYQKKKRLWYVFSPIINGKVLILLETWRWVFPLTNIGYRWPHPISKMPTHCFSTFFQRDINNKGIYAINLISLFTKSLVHIWCHHKLSSFTINVASLKNYHNYIICGFFLVVESNNKERVMVLSQNYVPT